MPGRFSPEILAKFPMPRMVVPPISGTGFPPRKREPSDYRHTTRPENDCLGKRNPGPIALELAAHLKIGYMLYHFIMRDFEDAGLTIRKKFNRPVSRLGDLLSLAFTRPSRDAL